MSVISDTPAPLRRPNWRTRYPALSRFTRSWVNIASLVLVLGIVAAALAGPVAWGVSPSEIDFDKLGLPEGPSAAHPAGTDDGGRDMLARLLMGAQISLAVGVISMLINAVIGVGLGTLAGWLGGWVDTALMRLVDALYSIPILLIVILIQLFVQPTVTGWSIALTDAMRERHGPGWDLPLLLSPDLLSIFLALGLANWLTMARLARSEVINLKESDFVASGRALGIGNVRLLFRHVLPNSLAPLLVAATLAIPEAIFIESFLAFIGLGVSAPQASWGTLAADGVKYLGSAPHLLMFPAIAISLAMLGFNLLGDGLRDAMDPTARDH